MSIIINVEQSPLTITPTNAEHIYTLSSTGYTLSNFKYLIDVYFKPQGKSEELMSRLKIAPNTYGNAIIELGEIVRTFLNANPRFSGDTYPYLNYVADENSVITLSDAQQTRDYNAYNLWSSGNNNANLNQLWHVAQYRAVVGCEYSSGGTIVTDINPSAEFQPDYITIFPGVDNTLIPSPDLFYATLGGTYNQSSNFFQVDNQGWYYYDLFRHVYQRPNAKQCNNYQISNTDPESSIILNYLDCNYNPQMEIIYPQTSSNFCALDNSIEVVSGGEEIAFEPTGICNGYNPIQDCAGPQEFLNAAGVTECAVVQADGTSTTNVRRRMHHPDCPMIVSFLNGKNDYFTNDIYSIAVRGALSHNEPYTYSAEIANRNSINIPTTEEPPNSTFRMANFYLPYNITSGNTLNAIPTNAEKVCFYGTFYDTEGDRLNINNATTEVLEYWMQPRDCINEPIHVLFMNGRGMWDTYTFGKKNTKKITLDRKEYQQETSLDKQFYARGSSDRGKKIYEQNATYEWDCNTWFMTEADTKIMEELFMSQDVFIITGTTIEAQDCVSCLNEIRLYQHLIPVTVKQTEFVEYKKQYQKIYQYNLTLQFGAVKRFRTQGA